jgi:hypothetical protein
MSEQSIYPDAIDGYAQLPLVIDGVTRIDAVTVNRIRCAIINIEEELGIVPSGAYSTVGERLDVIEAGSGPDLTDLEDRVTQLEDDVANLLPPLSGVQYAALVENPIGTTGWLCLRPSFLCPDFVISSFAIDSGNLIEVGNTLSNPSFTASYTSAPTSATIIDDDGGLSQDVSGTPNNFSYTGSYTKNLYGSQVSWDLDVGDGIQTDMDSVTKTWTQLVFWGVGPAGGNSEAFIEALANNALDTNRNRTFTVNAGGAEKIYFAYRSAYGPATFTIGGFDGGFFQVSSTISVTNSFGFTENYRLYESDNLGLGSTTVVVS